MATKTGRLELLCQVEGLDGHRVAFADRAGHEHDVPAVAVAEQVELEDVALAGPGRQAGARPHALDVDDDDGNLGEVRQADELGHQRDARARRWPSGPGRRPNRADGHADRGQLVLGLHDGEGLLAIGLDAVLLEELLGVFREAAGRGDRIPGQHARAAEQHAQGRRPCSLRSGSGRGWRRSARRGTGDRPASSPGPSRCPVRAALILISAAFALRPGNSRRMPASTASISIPLTSATTPT